MSEKGIRKTVIWAASVLLALLSWAFSSYLRLQMEDVYQSVSLRFNGGMDKASVGSYLEKWNEKKGGSEPTFWGESDALLSVPERKSQSTARHIFYYGSGEQVLPRKFSQGVYPGKGDALGCAVSEELAYRLFGGTNVVGMTIDVDEKEYAIRGVFKGKEQLFLTGAGLSGGEESFTAAELPFTGWEGRMEAEGMLGKIPLPTEYTMHDMPLLAGVLGGMSSLPIWVLFFVSLRFLLEAREDKETSGKFMTRYGIPIVLCFIPAVWLTGWSGRIPTRLIPTKWSDFSFWSRLFEDLWGEYREFLSMVPYQKDVWFRECATGIVAASLLSALLIGVASSKAFESKKAFRNQGKCLFSILAGLFALWLLSAKEFPVEVNRGLLLGLPILFAFEAIYPFLRGRLKPHTAIPNESASPQSHF